MHSTRELWLRPLDVLNRSPLDQPCTGRAPFNYGTQRQSLLDTSQETKYFGSQVAPEIEPLFAQNSATLSNHAVGYGLFSQGSVATNAITSKSYHLGVSPYGSSVIPPQINTSGELLSYGLSPQGALATGAINSTPHHLGVSPYAAFVLPPQIDTSSELLSYGLSPQGALATGALNSISHHLGVSPFASTVFPPQISASGESLSCGLYPQGPLSTAAIAAKSCLGGPSYASPVFPPQIDVIGKVPGSYSLAGETSRLLATSTSQAMLGLQFVSLGVRTVRRLTVKEIRAIFSRYIIGLFGVPQCLQPAQEKQKRISDSELNRRREKVKSLNPPIRLVFHTLHPDELAA